MGCAKGKTGQNMATGEAKGNRKGRSEGRKGMVEGVKWYTIVEGKAWAGTCIGE